MISPTTGDLGLRFLTAVTNLCNMMLAGKIKEEYTKIIFGASLCALNKKDDGIRPIAVGNTFRCLTSKLACSTVRSDMSSKFQPKQVGFGTRGGGAAAVHATRSIIKKNKGTNNIVLKIDFRNAFNEIDRDHFLG